MDQYNPKLKMAKRPTYIVLEGDRVQVNWYKLWNAEKKRYFIEPFIAMKYMPALARTVSPTVSPKILESLSNGSVGRALTDADFNPSKS